MAELKALVIKGRIGDAQGGALALSGSAREVARRFNVTVHKSTVGKWLRRLELTRLQPARSIRRRMPRPRRV